MKIAIDISQIVYGTGVSVYTQELVSNLLKLPGQDSLLLFAGSMRRFGYLKEFTNRLTGNFQTKFFPIPPTLADLIWNKLHMLPIEILIGNTDVFHSSDWTQPPSKSFKVTTVHDLAPLIYPDLSVKDGFRNIYRVHKRRLEWVKKEADRIIVPSRSTKNDLVKIGFKEQNIRVIPEAVNDNFKKSADSEIKKVKEKFQIYGEYLIAIGANPRKNTQNIIKAYEQSKLGNDLKLVIVGTPQGLDIKQERGLRMVGRISNWEKQSLLSGARALVYPSLYEGFGLPILEAFACECPVVTSNISSMPEVAGNAAELVDPLDIQSIQNGIKKVLKNRDKYTKMGKKRLADFSWQKTAQETLGVYKESNRC